MRVHIVRSPEVSKSLVKTIYELIEPFGKPVKFKFKREDLTGEAENLYDNSSSPEEQNTPGDNSATGQTTLTWKELFSRCDDFRMKEKIDIKDAVVLLTDHDNEENWFSSWDPSGRRNFFIQTSHWDKLVDAESCYPVLYELAIIPLYLESCKTAAELKQMAHYDTRGCPFDFCEDKSQVQIRLRTGDICFECHKLLTDKKLDFAKTGQVFRILEMIRSRILFRNRFGISSGLPSMDVFTANQKLIFFNDSGKVTVHLDKRQMAVYLLFLNHPEGILFKEMSEHYNELKRLYKNYVIDANQDKFKDRLNRMTNTVKYNTLSEITSPIKKKLKHYLWEGIFELYSISGDKGGLHTITVDRTLVTINGKPFSHIPIGLV